MPWRIRLRFRTGKALNTDDTERWLEIASRPVRLSSLKDGQPLKEARWLVMGATGLRSEPEAREFGEHLKLAMAFSSLCCRLGVDLGHDLPTSVPGSVLIDAFRERDGTEVRANVHGLDVFPDDRPTRFFVMEADVSVLASAERFLAHVEWAAPLLPEALPNTRHAITLLNAALMSMEPLSRLALAISAVEMLGQGEQWSRGQRGLLERLACAADSADDVDPAEAAEVADAIRRSTHRLGLRQGVLRVLDALDLDHLKSEWDAVYGKRSGLFHGTLRLTQGEVSQIADEAFTLCARIVLAAAEAEGAPSPDRLQDLA